MLAIPLLLVSVAQASAQIGMPPQCEDFVGLRQDVEQRGKAIKAANDRKASPQEACPLFTRYIAAEGKMIKFMEDNRVWCGVPEDAIKQIKAAHGRAQQVKQQVCKVAASGAAPAPKRPSLGELLGTSTVTTPDNTKTGPGTFDTLTGNPLAR